MRIEGITVSVGFSDLLAHTLLFNKGVFDRMLVVTDEKDDATKRVCDSLCVEWFATSAFYENGQKFNKGAGINAGLEYLNFQDWVVHLDADIALPHSAHHRLRHIPLDEKFLYGCDRLMCNSYEDWANFIANPVRQEYPGSVWPVPFEMGYRYLYNFQYLPIGYFQMFNKNAKAFFKYEDWYPTKYDTAANSDLVFGQRWAPEHRKLIPEMFCFHLASSPEAKIGADWAGRKTPKFC